MRKGIVLSGVAGLLVALLADVGAVPASPRNLRFGAGGSGGAADPYPLYPALDLAQIPWHAGVGGWGPQAPLEAPALPVTTRNVTVHTIEEFNAEARVAGTRITIGMSWDASALAVIAADDIDVILPAGVSIGMVEFGYWPRTELFERVRIRGSLDGSRGGRMGQFRSAELGPAGTSGIVADVVLEGIDINGASPLVDTYGIYSSAERFAVINCRVISAGWAWLGRAKHMVIANSNVYRGAATRADGGLQEGWGIRNGAGPVTIVDSRVQGTRYHNLRLSSSGDKGVP